MNRKRTISEAIDEAKRTQARIRLTDKSVDKLRNNCENCPDPEDINCDGPAFKIRKGRSLDGKTFYELIPCEGRVTGKELHPGEIVINGDEENRRVIRYGPKRY